MNAESERLLIHHERQSNWKMWGPYLSDRAWGTIREDYGNEKDPWRYFPHEQSRSRAYRWNEDGLGGISDRNQYLCFALALWNGNDPILKERFFGVNNHEGNHGEDVKDYYFYLDNTPTHSYMKMLYKYPHNRFPYSKIVEENLKRGYKDLEFELIDTGIFDRDEYFDIFIEYAKVDEEDILIEISIFNRSDRAHSIHVLPTLWFRNTWSWGYPSGPMKDVPKKPIVFQKNTDCIEAHHENLGTYYLFSEESPEMLFTENNTNRQLLFKQPNETDFVKDAFHRYIVNNELEAVNPKKEGTKSAMHFFYDIPGKDHVKIRLRLSQKLHQKPFENFSKIFLDRKHEADEFYLFIQKPDLEKEDKLIQRRAFAGLLWSKQLYYYDVEQWLSGDASPDLPANRNGEIRNYGWEHLVNFDIISMPDKWEYPWYASWDLAFHCMTLVMIDPDFAKRQLILMSREWYMHPNGQLPAYEWNFSDVNPPVHAWAALRVYQIDAKNSGKKDRSFLEAIFHKLLLNFTWWVNRKDFQGNNVFQGGFLGLDNISIFDRSKPLPFGAYIDQSDTTAWMAFYCVEMMKIALELAKEEPIYEDSATKFFEHFQRIAAAMNNYGDTGYSLWDEEDGFFYDGIHLPDKRFLPLKVRSLVGLFPLFAMETLEPETFENAPTFKRRVEWFTNRHAYVDKIMADVFSEGTKNRRQMSLVSKDKLLKILQRLFDEKEFLSEFGIRSLSKYHQKHPYVFNEIGLNASICYEPAESFTKLFGGNSNWRGPIWFPINYLIIESLQKYHHYYGDELKVDFPTGSGNKMDLKSISAELSKRLLKIFKKDKNGKRPIYGGQSKFQSDPLWRDNFLFYEYFHGDNGAGLGASHQTGWTAIIAKLIQQSC